METLDNIQFSNVPYYTREQIEAKTIELITSVDSSCLIDPVATPIGAIVETLSNEHAIKFVFHEDLGLYNSNSKILGKCDLKTKTIYIDPSVQSHEGRMRFTLAHELGHLILHQQVVFSTTDPIFEDDISQLYRTKYPDRSDLEWLEWHANKFASSLLMPKATFIKFVNNTLNKMDLHLNPGKIYLDDQHCNKEILLNVLNEISLIFQTSKQASEIRLRDFDYIIDNRKRSQSMSELLSWFSN